MLLQIFLMKKQNIVLGKISPLFEHNNQTKKQEIKPKKERRFKNSRNKGKFVALVKGNLQGEGQLHERKKSDPSYLLSEVGHQQLEGYVLVNSLDATQHEYGNLFLESAEKIVNRKEFSLMKNTISISQCILYLNPSYYFTVMLHMLLDYAGHVLNLEVENPNIVTAGILNLINFLHCRSLSRIPPFAWAAILYVRET